MLKELDYRAPIIVMTGHADAAGHRGDEGVFDFIEKPFDEDLLLQALRAALEKRKGPERTG